MTDTAQAYETPITDLLRSIPADARMIYEESPMSNHNIPVGVLAKKALDTIDRLTAERDALRATISNHGKNET